MTLPVAPNALSLQDVNVELNLTANQQIDCNDTKTRYLAGRPSGVISFDNLHGASNIQNFTISSNQQELVMSTFLSGAGWNGFTRPVVTINAGVYIWSDTLGTAALRVDGSYPAGITIINNGYIMGRGGDARPTFGSFNGSPAVLLSTNCIIYNNGYIAGGGGGGSHTGNAYEGILGGGGAGGGWGGGNNLNPVPPGSVGANGNSAIGEYFYLGGGGQGGRILPGVGGDGGSWTTTGGDLIECTFSTAGAGGGGGQWFAPRPVPDRPYFTGGGGGGWGASAGPTGTVMEQYEGQIPLISGGNGGSGSNTGSSGSIVVNLVAGGAGGKAVELNGYSITWGSTGIRYGAVS